MYDKDAVLTEALTLVLYSSKRMVPEQRRADAELAKALVGIAKEMNHSLAVQTES